MMCAFIWLFLLNTDKRGLSAVPLICLRNLLCFSWRTLVLDTLLTILSHSPYYFLPVLPTLRLIVSSTYLIPLPLYGSGALFSLISAANCPTFSLSIPLTMILF